ncbi:hypothetical protein [Comamonas granuli]|uniref:hypothetical protein n=1 Tax=Comamonas granuli TaxID=290309 RepID=UPI0005AB38B6|nr:hypothetical protein [Comamonas granuli]
MTVNLNLVGTIASVVSLILAVVFWWLTSRQAERADSILAEIRDKMLSWQNDINNAAINLIQARPEVIAQKVSLEEAKSQAAFAERLATVAESLATGLTEDSAGYRIAALKEILDHQRQSLLGSEQIKATVVAAQQATTSKVSGHQP